MATASPSLSPVYLVCGPEAFLRREAVNRVASAALEGHGDAFGRTVFDGERASLAEVLDEVRTLTLLGDRRVVVLDDADDFISKNRAALEKYCASPSDTGCLILVTEGADARTRLYGAVKSLGGVVRCELPKYERDRAPWVRDWIINRAAGAYLKRVPSAIAIRLRELVGDSLGLLDQELEKLASYVNARPDITDEDLEALVGNHRERTVFDLTDAMSRGDAAGALRLWERVLATDRAAPHRAIGGLAWGIRRRMETDPNRRLQEQLCDLLEADWGSKTGLAGVDRAVERFIVKHCAETRR